jgi:hypothetical protein
MPSWDGFGLPIVFNVRLPVVRTIQLQLPYVLRYVRRLLVLLYVRLYGITEAALCSRIPRRWCSPTIPTIKKPLKLSIGEI